MAEDRNLTCRCGQMAWSIAGDAPGTHLVCHCRDCQGFARHLGVAEAMLDAHGGTELFQIAPENLRLTDGVDHLSVLRLSDKGLLRWYAGCCGTPIANTLPGPGLPFAGMVLPREAPGFGPITARTGTAATGGAVKARGGLRAGLSLMVRALRSRLTGGHRRTPFFGPDGAPVRHPKVLSAQERAAAGLDPA
ncbi:DUF6151 family protein [Pseudoponticoccus marisrubri]|uniref:CENP-V/GFA domain-containing protein n=1 Tax=Pseudoponticoccus marisrubri TaxID=1685382 RepID=A0A0W7WMX6_9RHOB|nr:DUF6151 family protein [Pseudoponticoccus marisrubri]KUF11879.1 hypothetical protein AVJ23_04665 [Pseudoponticoccus marisrubri]